MRHLPKILTKVLSKTREEREKERRLSKWAHVIKTIRPNVRNYINQIVNVIKMSVILPGSVSFHMGIALL